MNNPDRAKYYPPDPIRIRASISGLSTDGRGVAQVDNRAVFVDGALPGDEVEMQVDWQSKPPRGMLINVISASPARVAHPCPHGKQCPACPLGALNYSEQLHQKTEIVKRTLGKMLDDVSVSPMVAAPEGWHYRNRVSLRVWEAHDRLQTGYRLSPRSEATTAIGCCRLAAPEVDRCIGELQTTLANYRGGLTDRLPARIQIHQTAAGAGMMIVFPMRIHASQRKLWRKWLSDIQVPGGVWYATGNRAGLISGNSWVQEDQSAEPMITTWMAQQIKVHPASFCQANAAAAEQVCRKLQKQYALSQPKTIWDLYGGYGALGFAVADSKTPVRIIEASKWSEATAITLAAGTDCSAFEFIRGDVLKAFSRARAKVGESDLIILDPPKSGAHPEVLKMVGESSARRVCYLSCNPARLGRDLQILRKHGFNISDLTPFDFFPQTASIEVLAILTR